jgi:hypothetical protein
MIERTDILRTSTPLTHRQTQEARALPAEWVAPKIRRFCSAELRVRYSGSHNDQ